MVLLTGASGFLGKAIAQNLVFRHVQFLTIGRQVNNHILCDLSIEIPVINNYNIDLVIHAAGKAHFVPKTKIEKQTIFDVNLTGTLNFLKGLENSVQLPKFFVFISSVAVYGQETGLNINEKAPLNAKDYYGLSKIQAEEMVMDWCIKNKIICTILRLPLVVGVNPPGNLGAMKNGIKKGYYFNIAGGKAKKSMVLANDVAEAVTKLSTIGGIYNLTDNYHPSFDELSNSIAIQLGKPKPFNIPVWLAKFFAKFGDLLGDKISINSSKLKKITSDLTFDDSKARELGWKSQYVLQFLKNNKL
jgi:nucleoside-diphosphate-sugar epimerase